jgi:hypothetical protein
MVKASYKHTPADKKRIPGFSHPIDIPCSFPKAGLFHSKKTRSKYLAIQ